MYNPFAPDRPLTTCSHSNLCASSRTCERLGLDPAFVRRIFREILDEPEYRDWPHAGIAIQAYLTDTEQVHLMEDPMSVVLPQSHPLASKTKTWAPVGEVFVVVATARRAHFTLKAAMTVDGRIATHVVLLTPESVRVNLHRGMKLLRLRLSGRAEDVDVDE